MHMTQWLEGGPAFNLWSLTIAITGLLLTVFGLYLAFNSRREKRPLYLTNSFEVLSKERKVDGLEVTLSGLSIPSLTITRVALWNAGRETINRTDILAVDPLRIVSSTAAKILGAKLSHVQRHVNDVQIEVRDECVLVTADFLDFKDGCIVDIYHVESTAFKVVGTLKGSPYPADSRAESRYKADLAANWFFKQVPESLIKLHPVLATLLIFPLYVPFRLATIPFAIVEMLMRPLSQSTSGPPDGFKLK